MKKYKLEGYVDLIDRILNECFLYIAEIVIIVVVNIRVLLVYHILLFIVYDYNIVVWTLE